MYQSMSALLHLGKLITFGNLGVEWFQSSLEISGELYISSSYVSSPSFVQVGDRTYRRSLPTSNSIHTLLDGGSLASHSSQYTRKHSSCVLSKKISPRMFSLDWMLMGLPSLHWTLLLLRVMLNIQGLSSSVCQAVVGMAQASTAKVY